MSRSPISTTSLREELRTELRASLKPPARSSSMRRPSLPRHCCSAAAPSACGEGQDIAGRRDLEGLSPSRHAARRASVFRPSTQQSRDRKDQRLGTSYCRRRQGARLGTPMPLFATAPTGRLPRPSARSRQRNSRPPCLSGDRHGDRNHRFGKFRASQSRLLPMWVAVLHGVHEYPPGYVLDAVLDSRQCLCVRRGRPSGSPLPARCEGDAAWPRIDLVDLAHSYSGNAADPESFALKPISMTWRQGGAYALSRAVGLRQDHAAQSDLGHRHAVARQDPVRRRRYHTAVNPEAQYRAGVPVSGDLRQP